MSRKLPDDIRYAGSRRIACLASGGFPKGGAAELMTGRKRWSHLIGRMLRLWKPAGPKPVPVVQTRYDRWTARVMDGQLDFWGENWADLSGTQQYADWQQLIQSRGGTGDPQYYMTRGLLPEVLYAAGGVERELGHLADALAQVQLAADNVLAGRDISAANWPARGHQISTDISSSTC